MTLVAPRKPHPNHRVRSGQHQRRSKHFAKTYWPYLPMLMIAGVMVLGGGWWAPQAVLGASTDLSASNLLALTNEQRSDHHENLLSLDSRLDNAAQAKANDMVARNYWSHITPDGRTPWSFMMAAGYNYQLAGENLAYGFSGAGQTITAWMNSPEHRANILNNDYSEVGFGVANTARYQGRGPTTVVVAMYAEPSDAPLASAAVTKPTSGTPVAPIDSTSQPVARVQLLTGGQAPWSLFVLSVVGCLAIAVVALRHVRFWRRALATSEAFVIEHPMLDIAVLALGAGAFLLNQVSGFIQ